MSATGAAANTTNAVCICDAIGPGVQTFRIRKPLTYFECVEQLPGIPELWLSARAIWACRRCGRRFAWMRIPYKDEEEIIVRPGSNDSERWDWRSLAQIADGCRWRGPTTDPRYVL